MDPRYAGGCAWTSDGFVPIDEARIPILDTGFSRSDVTYDVVGVWKGAFFRLDDHLDRFERSYRALRMTPPKTRDQIREILIECVRRSGLRESYVDMIVSRGVALPSVRDPRRFENRFYAYAVPYVWIVPQERQEKGAHVVIAQNTQRIPPESVDPTVKNFHWGDLVRGAYEAFDRGGELVVLPDADGQLTEGPGFNLFAAKNGALFSPPRGVLEGITRRTIFELAEARGIPASLSPIDGDFLRDADEAFATSTAGGVMPLTTVDGRPLGSGVPGPLTTQLRDAYWAAHEDPRYCTPVDYGD